MDCRERMRSSWSRLAIGVLLGSSAVAAQVPGQEEPARRPPHIVLAVVNGHELTLESAIDTFLSSHTGHGVLIRGEPAVRDLTGRLVERELFLEEARTLGVPDEPAVADLLTRYARRIAADEFWRREVRDRATVTDEEVEAFYAKTDLALRLTLIEAADRAAAEALKARILAGEDMGELARKESIHSSRTFDGSLQYVRRGELERTVEEAAFALEEPGSLSEVVQSEKGFSFVRLEERSLNPERPPRDQALPQIRGILEERATKRLAAEVNERVLQEAGASLDEEALSLRSVLDAADASVTVARAGADSLTLQDVRDGLDLEALRAADPAVAADAARDMARQWMRAEAIAEAAGRAGLLEDPGIVAKVETFRRDVVMKYLCERYVWPGDAPPEDELRQYYEARVASDFTTAPEVHLAYIVVPEADAQGILERLQAGESFEALAREVSLDPVSAQHGGRIGWIKPGQILPEVEERAFALEPGRLEGPITTAAGSFLVKVLERKEPRVIPYASARATVLKRLTEQRQADAYARWATALRERAEVRLDEAGVRAATEWLESEALAREAEKARRVSEPGVTPPPGHGKAPREGGH